MTHREPLALRTLLVRGAPFSREARKIEMR
jgi:hypothetical protein